MRISMCLRVALVVGCMMAAAGCDKRPQLLAECLDSRLQAASAWHRYNSTLRSAAEQAQRTGGHLDVHSASPPSMPFQLAEYGRTFEGVVGIASTEAAAAKQATEAMWQQCRMVCEDMLCTGLRGGASEGATDRE